MLSGNRPGRVGEGLVHAINGLRVKVLHEMVRSLELLVLDLDPTLSRSASTRGRGRNCNFLGHEGVTIQALAGIDMALWDLRGKAAELNVSRLIWREVPVYASGRLWLSSSIDELQREAADFVAAGFRAVESARCARKARSDGRPCTAPCVRPIVPDIGLMVDANQQLSVPEAILLARALEPFRPHLVRRSQLYLTITRANRLLQRRSTHQLPVARQFHTHRGILRMLQLHAADILMPDLQRWEPR